MSHCAVFCLVLTGGSRASSSESTATLECWAPAQLEVQREWGLLARSQESEDGEEEGKDILSQHVALREQE